MWSVYNKYKLVNIKVQCLYGINPLRGKKNKIVYIFLILTFPYFTSFIYDWYILEK